MEGHGLMTTNLLLVHLDSLKINLNKEFLEFLLCLGSKLSLENKLKFNSLLQDLNEFV